MPRLWQELGLALLMLLGGGIVACVFAAMPVQALVGATVALAVIVLLLARFWGDPQRSLGPANQVTLVRAVLVCMLVGALFAPAWGAQWAWLLAAISMLALVLDGVDGWVARRWRCASAYGARFDMELDALLILVLCAHLLQMGKAGSWVLAIGLMRYGFVAAMLRWPWLGAPLPDSDRRKLVCVVQVASLLLCLLPLVDASLATAFLLPALALLAWSFAVDVHWLHRAVRGGTADNRRREG